MRKVKQAIVAIGCIATIAFVYPFVFAVWAAVMNFWSLILFAAVLLLGAGYVFEWLQPWLPSQDSTRKPDSVADLLPPPKASTLPDTKPSDSAYKWLCPECESEIVNATPQYRETYVRTANGRSEKYRSELTLPCGGCGNDIPLWLAERQGGVPASEARRVWKEGYFSKLQLRIEAFNERLGLGSRKFICPECGATEAAGFSSGPSLDLAWHSWLAEQRWPDGTPFKGPPMLGAYHICAGCKRRIPARVGLVIADDSAMLANARFEWQSLKDEISGFPAIQAAQDSMTRMRKLFELVSHEDFDQLAGILPNNNAAYRDEFARIVSIANTQPLSLDELRCLVKGLAHWEESAFGGLGSTTRIPELIKHIPPPDDPLIEWLLSHTRNPYLPFGGGGKIRPNGVTTLPQYMAVLRERAEIRNKNIQRDLERQERDKQRIAAKATKDIFAAIRRKDYAAISALIRKGAELNIKGADGLSASEVARSLGISLHG